MRGPRPAGSASRASRCRAASCYPERRGPRALPGRGAGDTEDQVGFIDGGIARFGKSYIGEPDKIAADLANDAAVREADTLLVTVPNQLGVDYNAGGLLAAIAEHVAPAIGWHR